MAHIPGFVCPYPRRAPITLLPPAPLGPAPPGSFSFLPPTAPYGATIGHDPFTSSGWPHPAPLPPAPLPPGPFLLPLPSAPALVQPPFAAALQAPQQIHATQPLPPPHTEPPAKSIANSEPLQADADAEPEENAAIHSVHHGKSIHTFKPKKGPISKSHRDALSDFEERTRRHEYGNLASKRSSSKSERPPAELTESAPRSILKNCPAPTVPVINQEVHVNVHNAPIVSPPRKSPGLESADDERPTRPAPTSASIREESIKEADSLARSIAVSAAAHAAATIAQIHPSHVSQAAPANGSGAPGSNRPSKAPSNVSAAASANRVGSVHLSRASAKAPSNQSGPRASPKPGSKLAHSPSHHCQSQRSRSFYPTSNPNPSSHHFHLSQKSHPSQHSYHSHPSRNFKPPTLADVAASARQRPLSVETWREGVTAPFAAAGNVPLRGLVPPPGPAPVAG